MASLHSIPDVHTGLQWLDTYAQRRCQTNSLLMQLEGLHLFYFEPFEGCQYTMMLKKSMVSSFHVMFLPPIMDVANTCSNMYICFGWTPLCPPKHDHWRKGTHTPNCDCLALLQREVRHLISLCHLNYCSSPPKMNITVFPFGFRTWARLLDKLRFPV